MNEHIYMTVEQTRIYDGRDERETNEMMSALLARAQQLANETGAVVEIYTADGIVADVREPA